MKLALYKWRCVFVCVLILFSGLARAQQYYRVVEYRFQKGDTVSDILYKHGVSGVKVLYGKYGMVPMTLKLNRMSDPEARKISVGQMVKVPIPVDAQLISPEVKKKSIAKERASQPDSDEPLGLVEVPNLPVYSEVVPIPDDVGVKSKEALKPNFQTAQIKKIPQAPTTTKVKAKKAKRVSRDRYTPYRIHPQNFWLSITPYFHRKDSVDKSTGARARLLSDLSFEAALDWSMHLKNSWSARAHISVGDLIYDAALPDPITKTTHNIMYSVLPGLRHDLTERLVFEIQTGVENLLYYRAISTDEIEFRRGVTVPLLFTTQYAFFRRKNTETGVLVRLKYNQGFGNINYALGYKTELYAHIHPFRFIVGWVQNHLDGDFLRYNDRTALFTASFYF
ncbi:MAG: LysM peptidoglycan-binding domain-containing protein [Bdellovibrionales bacterium]|nr:LysM peptidoglycan-binding domain-containing protein [Bdellovibrionales bacterium]